MFDDVDDRLWSACDCRGAHPDRGSESGVRIPDYLRATVWLLEEAEARERLHPATDRERHLQSPGGARLDRDEAYRRGLDALDVHRPPATPPRRVGLVVWGRSVYPAPGIAPLEQIHAAVPKVGTDDMTSLAVGEVPPFRPLPPTKGILTPRRRSGGGDRAAGPAEGTRRRRFQ